MAPQQPTEPITDDRVRIVPANEVPWADLQDALGSAQPRHCQCQRYKVLGWLWRDSTEPERIEMLRGQTHCGNPDAPSTTGLVAYVDDEPAGWVAVEPRTAYPKLLKGQSPVSWKGRDEDRGDDSVWSVTCLAVRSGFRGRGLTYHLAAASMRYAHERGARAVEAYPMLTEAGKQVIWEELHVGAAQVFEEAGFVEVSHPTKRRVVMRVEF